MTIIVEATYEGGVLRPAEPLPLAERQKVRVIVEEPPIPIVEAYGIIKWTGDRSDLERFAMAPEFDPQEGP